MAQADIQDLKGSRIRDQGLGRKGDSWWLCTSKSFSVISSTVCQESKPASTKLSKYWDMPSQDRVSSRSAIIRRRCRTRRSVSRDRAGDEGDALEPCGFCNSTPTVVPGVSLAEHSVHRDLDRGPVAGCWRKRTKGMQRRRTVEEVGQRLGRWRVVECSPVQVEAITAQHSRSSSSQPGSQGRSSRSSSRGVWMSRCDGIGIGRRSEGRWRWRWTSMWMWMSSVWCSDWLAALR